MFLAALLLSEILDQSLALILFATALGNQKAKTSRQKAKSIGSLSDFQSDACHWARVHCVPILPSDQLN